MSLRYDITIELDTKRCWHCGCFWAVERCYSPNSECPRCAALARSSKDERATRLTRQVSALKGTITKLRKARGPKP